MPETIAQRFTLAFGGNDQEALRALYDEDVLLYGPLSWPLRGRPALLEYVGEFIRAYNPRIVLHDEFYDATGTRGCFTFVLHYHNTEPFYGHEPTGARGMIEQWVGDNSFQMPYMDLVTFAMEFPRDTPHPKPPIIEASVGR
jgi:hypothetical protein